MRVIRQHRYVDCARVHARIVGALAPQLLEDAGLAFLLIGSFGVLLDIVRHGAPDQFVPDPTVPDDIFGRLGCEVLAEQVGDCGAFGGVEAGDAGGGDAVALGVPDVVWLSFGQTAGLDEGEGVDGEGEDGGEKEREEGRWGWVHCLGRCCG